MMRTSPWLLLLLLAGCDGATPGKQAAQKEGSAAGEVVAARVNSQPITLGEVKRLSARSGLSPKLALERLVEERLLAQHAEERGYGDLPSVQRELKRARVRSLLERAVEPETGPASIASAEVERLFEEKRGKLPQGAGEVRLEDHEQALREHLSMQARRRKLDGLVKELRDGTRVVYDEPAIQQALAGDSAADDGT